MRVVLVPDVNGQFVAIIGNRQIADRLMSRCNRSGGWWSFAVPELARCALKLCESRSKLVECRRHLQLEAESGRRRNGVERSSHRRPHNVVVGLDIFEPIDAADSRTPCDSRTGASAFPSFILSERKTAWRRLSRPHIRSALGIDVRRGVDENSPTGAIGAVG